MTSKTFAARLAEDAPLLTGWLSLPEPHVAEICVRAGFDTVLIDMQHGVIDFGSAVRLLGAVRHCGGRAAVRIPVGEYQTASRVLDAGADIVIAPMIETAADAAAFARFVKYPPMGSRSWGPSRAVQLTGGSAEDYRLRANGECLAFVMIETRDALAALPEILALPEIDGVFVGPADLSVALSGGRALDVDSPEALAAIGEIARQAASRAKPAAIYAASTDHAKRYFAMGYKMVTPMSDAAQLSHGIRDIIARARA